MADVVAATSQEVAAAAFEAEQAIKATIRRMRAEWVLLAQQLYDFTHAEQWRHLGHESVTAWLASPDIALGYRHVYGLIEIHRELVLERGVSQELLAELPVSKVRDVLPAVRTGRATLEEALSDAEVLGREDLRERYSGISTVDEPLNADRETEWTTCQSCGSRIKVRS